MSPEFTAGCKFTIIWKLTESTLCSTALNNIFKFSSDDFRHIEKGINILILFFIIYRESKNNIYKSFFGTLFFSLSMSQSWAISEYSEVYSLFFISLAYLVLLKGKNTKSIFFLIGTLLSLSTLINQGSVLFIIPFLFYIFIKRSEISFVSFRNFSLGLVLPHVFFFLLY